MIWSSTWLILYLSAPVVQKVAENKSLTSAAVSNASTVPEADLADIIDVTPRTMDLNQKRHFHQRCPELASDKRYDKQWS